MSSHGWTWNHLGSHRGAYDLDECESLLCSSCELKASGKHRRDDGWN